MHKVYRPHNIPAGRHRQWLRFGSVQEQLPQNEALHSLTGDGAYDTQPAHEEVIKREGIPIITPRKNDRIRKGQAFMHRNAAIAASKYLEALDWISPEQLGGNQDELH